MLICLEVLHISGVINIQNTVYINFNGRPIETKKCAKCFQLTYCIFIQTIQEKWIFLEYFVHSQTSGFFLRKTRFLLKQVVCDIIKTRQLGNVFSKNTKLSFFDEWIVDDINCYKPKESLKTTICRYFSFEELMQMIYPFQFERSFRQRMARALVRSSKFVALALILKYWHSRSRSQFFKLMSARSRSWRMSAAHFWRSFENLKAI